MELFEKDTPQDLYMRGFSHDYILDKTGTTLNRQNLKGLGKYKDGASYCAEFILQNCTRRTILSAISRHAEGEPLKEMLNDLGVNIHRNIQKIFDKIGYSEEFNKSTIEYAKIKRAEAVREKYGVDCVLSLNEVREKGKETLIKKYGVPNCSQSDLIKQKKQDTVMAHYGVEYSLLDPEVRKKTEQTNLERYGAKTPFESETVREKARKTVESVYGVENPFQAESVKDKIKATLLEKYGVDNISKIPEIRAKAIETSRAKGKIKTLTEGSVYIILKNSFEENDIVREYIDERYPYPCDFYIKSRDLFIEVNAHISHGQHWFMENDEDIEYLEKLKANNNSLDRKIIRTWAGRDVEKRKRAKDENLNYIVFWGKDAPKECEEWSALGSPDAKDWEEMYSWRKK